MNWTRLDKMIAKAIDCSDISLLNESFFANVELQMQGDKISVIAKVFIMS